MTPTMDTPQPPRGPGPSITPGHGTRDGTRGNTAKGRSWVYTLNNYTEDDVERLRSLDCQAHFAGHEVGESGTPHLQGYIRFAEPKRFSWWKNQFPRCHVELRRGTETQAIEYASKDGQLVIEKFQEEVREVSEPKRSKHEETMEVISELEAGATFAQVRARHKVFTFWHRKNIIDYKRDTRFIRDNPGVDIED